MLQQGSCFTLHMPGAEKMDFQGGTVGNAKAANSYIICHGLKCYLQEQLRRMNFSWASLFPQLDSVAKEIRAAFGLLE
jgi:hypothetical protein